MKSDDNSADSARTSAGMGPNDETDLFPRPTNAAAAHAWSKEEPETEPLRQSWGRTWGRAAVLLACTGVVSVAIGFAGWATLRMHHDATATRPVTNPATSWAAPPQRGCRPPRRRHRGLGNHNCAAKHHQPAGNR